MLRVELFVAAWLACVVWSSSAGRSEYGGGYDHRSLLARRKGAAGRRLDHMGTNPPFPSQLVTGWPAYGGEDNHKPKAFRQTPMPDKGHPILQSAIRAIYHDYVLWGVPTASELVYYGDDQDTPHAIKSYKAAAMEKQMLDSQKIYQGGQWPREEVEMLSPFGGRTTSVPGSGGSTTTFPANPPPGGRGYLAETLDRSTTVKYTPENTEYYIEKYDFQTVPQNLDMVPLNPYEVNPKFGFKGMVSPKADTDRGSGEMTREHPNPSGGVGRRWSTAPSRNGDTHTLWEYQQQWWPRVEGETNIAARTKQQMASAQAAENAAAVAGTSKHNIQYSTGEWNGHVRMEGYVGPDINKDTYSRVAGRAVKSAMVDPKHHLYGFVSREASKYAYMRGAGCFPASTSTGYTIEYTASSVSATMATSHRPDQGAGQMAHAAWFANEVYLGPNEWYEVKFEAETQVNAVTTTGGGAGLKYWVKTFKLLYSSDGEVWNTYQDLLNYDHLFTANTNETDTVTNTLRGNIKGKMFRIHPQSWNERVALKVELTRCVVCGDGYHDQSEGCDDGNVRDDDGCSKLCWRESEFQAAHHPGVDWCTPGRRCDQCGTQALPQPAFFNAEGEATGTQTPFVDPRQSDTYTYNSPMFCPNTRPIMTSDVRMKDVDAPRADVWGTTTKIEGRGHR